MKDYLEILKKESSLISDLLSSYENLVITGNGNTDFRDVFSVFYNTFNSKNNNYYKYKIEKLFDNNYQVYTKEVGLLLEGKGFYLAGSVFDFDDNKINIKHIQVKKYLEGNMLLNYIIQKDRITMDLNICKNNLNIFSLDIKGDQIYRKPMSQSKSNRKDKKFINYIDSLEKIYKIGFSEEVIDFLFSVKDFSNEYIEMCLLKNDINLKELESTAIRLLIENKDNINNKINSKKSFKL